MGECADRSMFASVLICYSKVPIKTETRGPGGPESLT